MKKVDLTYNDNPTLEPWLEAKNLNAIVGALNDATTFYPVGGDENDLEITTANGNYKYVPNVEINITIDQPNTGAMTFNVDSEGETPFVNEDGSPFTGGEFEAGQRVKAIRSSDNLNFRFAPSGGGAQPYTETAATLDNTIVKDDILEGDISDVTKVAVSTIQEPTESIASNIFKDPITGKTLSNILLAHIKDNYYAGIGRLSDAFEGRTFLCEIQENVINILDAVAADAWAFDSPYPTGGGIAKVGELDEELFFTWNFYQSTPTYSPALTAYRFDLTTKTITKGPEFDMSTFETVGFSLQKVRTGNKRFGSDYGFSYSYPRITDAYPTIVLGNVNPTTLAITLGTPETMFTSAEPGVAICNETYSDVTWTDGIMAMSYMDSGDDLHLKIWDYDPVTLTITASQSDDNEVDTDIDGVYGITIMSIAGDGVADGGTDLPVFAVWYEEGDSDMALYTYGVQKNAALIQNGLKYDDLDGNPSGMRWAKDPTSNQFALVNSQQAHVFDVTDYNSLVKTSNLIDLEGTNDDIDNASYMGMNPSDNLKATYINTQAEGGSRQIVINCQFGADWSSSFTFNNITIANLTNYFGIANKDEDGGSVEVARLGTLALANAIAGAQYGDGVFFDPLTAGLTLVDTNVKLGVAIKENILALMNTF